MNSIYQAMLCVYRNHDGFIPWTTVGEYLLPCFSLEIKEYWNLKMTGGLCTRLTMSPPGEIYLITGSSSHILSLDPDDTKTERLWIRQQDAYDSHVSCLTHYQSGFLVGFYSGELRYCTSDGTDLVLIEKNDNYKGIVRNIVIQDSNHFFVASNVLTFWENFEETKVVSFTSYATSLTLINRNLVAFILDFGVKIQIYSLNPWKKITVLHSHMSAIMDLACDYRQDENLDENHWSNILVSGDWNGALRWWLDYSCIGHYYTNPMYCNPSIYSLAIYGSFCVAGTNDGTLLAWKVYCDGKFSLLDKRRISENCISWLKFNKKGGLVASSDNCVYHLKGFHDIFYVPCQVQESL